MYRILLVDDEVMELEALKNYIDWKKLGIEHVDTAKNGRIAYEKVLEKQPDIVIADIQMPGMDGIALAKKISELNSRIKIIFLTGYDDFSYVKEAFRVNAVDYLLKPFTEESIEEVIGKVKEAIEKDRIFYNSVEELEKQLLRRICTSEESREKELLEQFAKADVGIRENCCYGMVSFFDVIHKNVASSMEKRLAEIVAVWEEEGTLTFLIRGYVDFRGAAFRIQKKLEELTGKCYSGVYLKNYVTPEGLRSAYRMLDSSKGRIFYEEKGTLEAVKSSCAADAEPVHSLEQALVVKVRMGLEELLRTGDEKAARDSLEEAYAFFEENRMERADVLYNLYRILFKMEEQFPQRARMSRPFGESGLSGYYEELERCCCFAEIREYVQALLERISAALEDESGSRSAFVVKKVKEYIHKHYAEPMTVEAMADEIRLSSNYIRTIFKEGTGQTILEYITDYRFERACELLKVPTLKVKEVSCRVGYENVSYFCAVFTKRYKISPNEYRKRYL